MPLLKDTKKLKKVFYKTIKQYFGMKGEEFFLTEKQVLPTLGQITQKKFCGLTVLDNNLSRTPVFIQKQYKSDFLLVVQTYKGKKRYFLRKIKIVYTAG